MNLSATNAALGSGEGVEVATEPGHWTIQNTPAAATAATVTKAAVAGARHICKSICASIAAGATAQTPIRVVVRDGATGVGTVVWSKKLSAPINSCASVDIGGFSIVGSVNTAMTVEFTAAGVAASEQDVFISGITVAGGQTQ